ncbi:MAG: tetratricopeptide repeat protein [Methanotrichaceae archaeon]
MILNINFRLAFLAIVFIFWMVLALGEDNKEDNWKNMSISEIDNSLDQFEGGSHDFEVAENSFNASIRECSSSTSEQCVGAYYGKGRVLNDNRENYREAIKYFDQALKIDPSCCQCLDQKGWSLYELEDINLAISTADAALKICPMNAHIWNNKGIYYYMLNDYQKALECFNKAVECDPKCGDAWWDKGKAHIKLGQENDAALAFAKAKECGTSEQTTEQEE